MPVILMLTEKIKWKIALYACVLSLGKRMWSTSVIRMRHWDMRSKKGIEICEKSLRLRRLREASLAGMIVESYAEIHVLYLPLTCLHAVSVCEHTTHTSRVSVFCNNLLRGINFWQVT